MKILALQQGTPEWHAHRAGARNGSEAAASLGVSDYMTRSELLRIKKTGITPEIDAATQRRFDDGHKIEAFARPLAEAFIGEDLFPITVTDDDGYLSSSLDGLTMAEDIQWECKSSNDKLRAALDAGDLPDSHWPQVEQGLYITGAGKCLFTISDGTEEGTRHLWYVSKPERCAKVLAGWRQFDTDLADFVPQEVIPNAVAAPQESMPALSVVVTGSVAVRDNLGMFGDALRAYIDRINRKPQNDQDFANIDAAAKRLREVQERLVAAKGSMLGQISDVDSVRRAAEELEELARKTAIELEKLVKTEKEARRAAIVKGGIDKLREHINALNLRIGMSYMPDLAWADFAGATKGLKTLASIQNAVDTELARAKIAANEVADRIELNLRALPKDGEIGSSLFPDVGAICTKAPDDFAALVALRIAQHKEAEAKRQAKQAEEEAKNASARAMLSGAAAVPTTPAIDSAIHAIFHGHEQAKPDTGATIKLGDINARIAPLSISADGLRQLGFVAQQDGAAKVFRASDLPKILVAMVEHIETASTNLRKAA